MKKIILGAGITGLSAGLKTGFPIYEASDVAGGICRSYDSHGFHFANGGGHWIFGDSSPLEPYAKMNRYRRRAGVHINGLFDAPIQMGKPSRIPKGSMKQWMHDQFGDGLCKVFFDPFNERYTAGLYSKGIVQADPKKTPVSRRVKAYNATFAYPVGGLTKMVEKIAENCTIHYKKLAVKVDIWDKVVHFGDGTSTSFDMMVSTLPLKTMIEMCGFTHSGLLPHTSVVVLNIGAKKGKNCPKYHWIYTPQSRSGYFRVGFYSNVNQRFAPKGCVGLYVERAVEGGCQLFDPEGYRDMVIEELEALGWIEEVYVVCQDYINYAYTWTYEDSPVEGFIELLRSKQMYQIGRYGRWQFQGIAESFAEGQRLKWGPRQ